MAFSPVFANDLLKLILWGTAIANIANNASASPLTTLYAALHTAKPGDAQTDSEASYTSYARVAIARTSGGWAITANVASPAADVIFPMGTGGGGEVTHWSIGTASTGAGKVLLVGTLKPALQTGVGIMPRVAAASTLTLAT